MNRALAVATISATLVACGSGVRSNDEVIAAPPSTTTPTCPIGTWNLDRATRGDVAGLVELTEVTVVLDALTWTLTAEQSTVTGTVGGDEVDGIVDGVASGNYAWADDTTLEIARTDANGTVAGSLGRDVTFEALLILLVPDTSVAIECAGDELTMTSGPSVLTLTDRRCSH
jgi:hypothetical protein